MAWGSGCTVSTGVPGAPDIEIGVSDSQIKQACRDFARAFADARTADEMRANMTPAYEAAEEAAQEDPAAQRVAQAMGSFLISTSRSDAESAMNRVMEACGDVGITMTYEE